MMQSEDQQERVLRALSNRVPWVRERLPVLDTNAFLIEQRASGTKLIVVADNANERRVQYVLPKDFDVRDPTLAPRALEGARNALMAPFN